MQGDAVIQPGVADGGTSGADTLALLERWVPITFGGHNANRVDAAIARLCTTSDVSPFILQVGEIRGCLDLTTQSEGGIGEVVRKMGRSTHHTWGVIDATNVDVNVSYGQGLVARFENQIVVKPAPNGGEFAQPGDSGAVVTGETNLAIGLLFAVNSTAANQAWVNPIGTVLEELSVPGAVPLKIWEFGW